MANKNKGKVVKMLSPENYIRQKARTLPLYECIVNSDWKVTGMANVIVSRKHSNENITAGMYLVDTKCLGVKDASYWFNIPETQYRTILKPFSLPLAGKTTTFSRFLKNFMDRPK